MPHRGLRKSSPPIRRSLRPRNHTSSSGGLPAVRASQIPGRASAPRTAAETETDTGPRRAMPRETRGIGETPEREDFEDSARAGNTPAEPTTSKPAAEAADHPSSVAHDDPLAHEFFARSSEPHDEHDDHYVIHQLSRGSRRAMYASLGIFAVSIVCIGSYTIYQNWVMPAPVELGATVADIPAVPIPDPANVAPASARWSALLTQAGPAPVAPPSADAPVPAAPTSAPGTETQLSAATQAPVQFQVQGSAKSALRMNAASQPATGTVGVASAEAAPAQPAAAQPAVAAQPAAAAPPSAAAQPAAAQATNQAPSAEAEAKPAEAAPVAPKPEPVQVASAAEPDHPSGGLPTSASSGPTYDELVAVGRALSKRNKRVEASEAFRRALIQSPQGSAALSGLGYVYLNADEKQNAREYAQRAVQADASNAEGWIVLGAALELLGDRVGARDAYRKCVERGQGPYLTECRRVAR